MPANPSGGARPYRFNYGAFAPFPFRFDGARGLISFPLPVVSASAVGTYTFDVAALDSPPTGTPTAVVNRRVTLIVKASASVYNGAYRGRITWSWGPPIVSISPNPESISFSVREGALLAIREAQSRAASPSRSADGAISGDLVGRVDDAGHGTVQVTTFGSRGNISGTLTFSSAGSTVRVSGTVSGTLSTAGGVGRVSGRVEAERISA